MARLKDYYATKVVPELQKQFNYVSIMEVPRILKITINMGVGEAIADKKVMEFAVGDMTKIAGQKPVVTKARKSIAAYKIRTGYPVGCMVTLRKEKMYDFRGLNPKAFDKAGNYSFGVREQIIFPEIEYDKIDQIRGMDVTVTTTAKSHDEAKALLKAFNFPIK